MRVTAIYEEHRLSSEGIIPDLPPPLPPRRMTIKSTQTSQIKVEEWVASICEVLSTPDIALQMREQELLDIREGVTRISTGTIKGHEVHTTPNFPRTESDESENSLPQI